MKKETGKEDDVVKKVGQDQQTDKGTKEAPKHHPKSSRLESGRDAGW
jgi:hypothetical protein